MPSTPHGDDMPLSFLNYPASRLPGPNLLHELVQKAPPGEHPAVDFLPAVDVNNTSFDTSFGQSRSLSRSLSYKQLHDASDSLAAKIWHLAASDATLKKFIVPVLLPQGPELYVALLAILKAGGAFCPLNLDVPLERARFILQDVSATLVITNSELSSKIPSDTDKTIIFQIDDILFSTQPILTTSTPKELRIPMPSDLAYVMYTSGSTGTPKGVGVSHDAATQSLLAHNRHIPEFSRFLQFAAPTFDVSVFEIFFPLFRGKTLVSCSRSAMLNDLPGVIRTMEVDACELTPTVAGSLLRKRSNAPGLKLLLTIGEMLTKPVVEEFGSGSDGKDSILWAMYGPTEAAIHCTLQPAFSSDSGVGNIGIPFDTVSAFILPIPEPGDGNEPSEIEILPRDAVGELAVGGYQLADGYINRPEMTGKAFIDTPYGRLYRTGDKARIRADGTLECLGRISEGQVKLRGQRIELGEIEHAALRTPGCHSAFAAVIRNIIVLFCAVDDAEDTDVMEQIQKSCTDWLPGFMVPGDVVVVRDFPRLPSGKVDRKRLVAEYSKSTGGDQDDKTVSETNGSKFKDELEAKLCYVASELLGVDVAPNSHLSRTGMDSLLAIKFASTLRGVGIEATVIDILSSKTISILHGRVKEIGKTNSAGLRSFWGGIDSVSLDIPKMTSVIPVLEGLSGKEIAGIYPCTPLQTAMLAETKADPRAYCNWVELSFPPEHEDTTILSCFRQVVQENEALRTGFVHDGDRFLQVVFRHLDSSFATSVDLDHLVKDFEISNDRDFLHPFRLQVSRDQGTKGRNVVIQLHHAIYDGWSMDMILADLETLLAEPSRDLLEKPPMAPTSTSPPALSQAPKGFGKLPKTITQSFKAFARSSKALVRISKGPQPAKETTKTPKESSKSESKVPPVPAEPPKVLPQFHRVVAYYQSDLFQNECEAAREYWATSLAGFQPPPLPILRGQEHSSSSVLSTSVSIDVPTALVKEALSTIDVSTQSIFQAAVAWLWGALVGVEDVVVGAVTSGRTIPVYGVENIFGPCINTVPVRTNLAKVRTTQDLIASIHAANRAVLRHSVLPLSEIKKVAGFRPGQSIYDVLFVYQESLHSKSTSSRQIKQVSQRDYLETKLLVEVEGAEDVIDYNLRSHFRCRFTYHSDCFPKDYVKKMGDSIQALVLHMLKDLTAELSWMQQAFPKNILSIHNELPERFGGVPDLALAVERTVAKYPDRDALCFADHISDEILKTTTVSFSGLNRMANQIAGLLRQHGIADGEVVAVVMDKSVLLYAGILAILKVGCAYLPLLPSTPLGRVGTIFKQASIKLCITDTTTKQAFGESLTCRWIDVQSAQLDLFPNSNPRHTVDPRRISYIIYTSGSTGTPKGVCVTQLNIMSNLDVLSRIYPVKKDSRLLQSCSQAFDVSVFEIFFAWTQGMCLCSAANDMLFADLEHSIRKLGVSHLSMTPTVASLIDPEKVPKVRFLVTSGEAMTEVVARKWARQLYQGYGPSETTNICSVKKMDSGSGTPIIQHLGWSFKNTSTFVLFKDSLEVAPIGCFGELCFGGDQVAQGYLNMPELTATKFIEHPKYGRLYRSGDLGRMLPDGSMVITGRVDDQIKIRGQRVELGEINSIVREHEAVTDCTTVYLKGEELGNGQIVVFFVPKQTHESQFQLLPIDSNRSDIIQEIYRQLSARVPVYMVPSLIVPVSVLPVTPAGKLDRRRLGDTIQGLDRDYRVSASQTTGSHSKEDAGSWSNLERKVAETLARVFGVDRNEIGKWTPLTTLGLDSISAIRVSKQLQEKLGARIPISTIIRNPSVGKLAVSLSTGDHHADTTTSAKRNELLPTVIVDFVTANLKREGKVAEDILPCMPLQEAMLVASDQGSYLNKMLFRVNSNPEKLIGAWKSMCKRHGILRTCFVSTEDSRWPVVQVVLDGWEHPWLKIDACHKAIEDCVTDHANTLPIAVDTMQPVVSFATISKGGDTYLCFVCHHALYDGVAMERLLFEVEQTISGVDLLPPPAYDVFIQECMESPENGVDFWLGQLKGHEPKLITGFKTGDSEKTSESLVIRNLDTPLSQVNAVMKQLGVTLLSITQSAWALTLASVFHTDDICFGNVVSGRTLSMDRIEELVAPCFNTIPLRMDLSSVGPRNLDLMKAFQDLGPEVLQHQFTPLRRILQSFTSHSISQRGEKNQESNQSWRSKLFDTLLLLQHPPRPLDQRLWTLEMDDGTMDVPVVCEIVPNTHLDLLTVKLHLEQNQFPPELPHIVLDLFFSAFHSLLRYPDSPSLLYSSISSHLKERLKRLRYEQPAVPDSHTSTQDDENGWTKTESTIRDVLSTLSSSPPSRVCRHTTIYQLGLDSISAVQIASLLRKQGLNLTASDVISNPTCESLARHLDTMGAVSPQKELAYDLSKFQKQIQAQIQAQGIPSDKVKDILPCSPLQAGMMTQFVRSSGNDYFNYIDFQLDDSVDLDVVIEAWRKLYHAHPILRTRLVPIEHNDHAFAMLQFSPNFHPLPVSSFVAERDKSFHVDKWRLDAAHRAAMTPHGQLWSVALAETEKGITQHLAIHHCLYDAYSLQLLLADLATAICGEQIVPTPQANIRAAVSDILGQITASTGQAQGFWKSQADKTVINSFPVMTPLRESPRRILVESMASSMAFSDIERAVAKSGYTIQVILEAAWTRILSSYLGEESVVFGVVLSGRNSEATQNAMFPCITTLPVISRNTSSNQDLLQQVLGYNAELFKQQHQLLTRIQQWLGLPDTKLFDTLLVYQKFDVDTSETRPWRIVSDQAAVDYPISIEVEPQQGDRLKYQLTFFSDVLPREQASIILRQFDAVVKHLALNPAGNEDDLVQQSPDVFSILPPEQSELPAPVRFLHQFVEKQALESPHSTALHFVDEIDGDKIAGRKWTYQELNDNGNRVANMILPNVKTGDLVAVNFEKCPEAYFSILGVLKAGCSFVALDPGAPASRKQFIIEDSGASLVLSSKAQGGNLDFELSIPVVIIEEEVLRSQPSHQPILSRKLEPSDVCYCLYTSGTTGVPKGCEITHDNTVQCMLAFKEIFRGRWTPSSRWLQFASLHFDVSVLEQYWSWSVGITLVGAPRDLILEDLAGTINRLEITHIDLTPSLARLVHPDEVPTLCDGVFITGGEALKQEILDVWGSWGVIYNFYGPTEATIGVTVYPRVPQNGRASNIGRQFVNVGSYVLKPGTSTPVLKGAVGELCVSGRLVGKGYLRRDDLTAERFPTLTRFGERVYRTGDLVRVLHDGCFDFLGRADDQVKLRGQRLEIGEINHAIRTGVDEIKDVATIVVRNDKQQKDFLVSFVTAEARLQNDRANENLRIIGSQEAHDLCRRARLACQAKLPGYMVPTYILQLPFIPLSPNNKAEIKELKRLFKDLPQDELVTLSSSANGTKTQSFTESGDKIARVIAFRQSLDLQTLTPQSNIFELGIDSISVLGLSRALKKEGFPYANPSIILRNPVLADLCYALDSQKFSSNGSLVAAARQIVQACSHRHRSQICKELAVAADRIDYIAPCSPLQAGMLSRSATDGAYFNSFRFHLGSGTSISTLRKAWQNTVNACPILRTTFIRTTDGYVQVALKNLEVLWEDISFQNDLESEAEETIRDRWDAWITANCENVTRPMEILTLDNKVLVLHLFHGLYDATSLELILDRVVSEYLGLEDPSSTKTEVEDVAKVPSFLEALYHGPLQSFVNCRQFWVDHLRDAAFKPLTALRDAQGPGVVSANHEISFHDLELLRKRLGVTHQAIIQASWCWVLAKHFSIDPTIGMIVSGRALELDGAEKVVGPLFNTIPFHPNVRREKTVSWGSMIRQCHDFNSSTMAFQHVPLRDIQKWCSGGKPLFDILFSFQREEDREGRDGKLWKEMDSEPHPDYPLALEATLTSSNQLRLFIVGDGNAVGEDDVERLLRELESSLSAMARNPNELLAVEGAVINGVKNDPPANGHMDKPSGSSTDDFAWTEKARVLRAEIARLAGIAPEIVTEKTSILELGLDSIDLIKLSTALKRQGINIKTSQLMKARTISAILYLTLLDEGLTNGAVITSETSQAQESYPELRNLLVSRGYNLQDLKIVLPATPLQDSMMAEMIESNFQLYYNHDILEISPGVDIDRLKEAWMTVIRGSPILRTSFIPISDQQFDFAYCQVVTNDDEPKVHVAEIEVQGRKDLAGLVDAATERARKANGASHLLQLSIASAPGQKWLILSIAHALYDGRSLDLVHQDVQAAYEGHYQTRPAYESYLRDVVFVQSDEAPVFWSGFLDGAVPTIIPERPDALTNEEKIHRAEAGSSVSMADIKTFCKRHAITTQTLGQACMAALLANRTASLDVTFGVVLSGRDSEEAENLMFPTMNTVAMRSVLHGTVSSWLRYMQENSANAAPFSHFPLRKAKKLVKGLSGPLFNALFIQQRRPESQTTEGEERQKIMKSVDGSSAVEYPLCVEMEVVEEGLVWRVACDDRYVSESEVSLVLHQLDLVLGSIVGEPDADVMKFSGQGVSVCGLPEFTPRTSASVEDPTSKDDNPEEDTPLSPIEERIIGVLADVSGVPASSILRTHNIYNLGLDSIGAMRVSSALLRKEKISLKFRDIVGAKSIRDMARLVNGARVIDEREVVEAGTDRDIPLPDILTRFNSGLSEKWIENVFPATAMQIHMLSVWLNTNGEVFFPEFKYSLSENIGIDEIGSAWSRLVAETTVLRTVFCATGLDDVPILQVVLRSDAACSSHDSELGVESRTWLAFPHKAMGLTHQPVPLLTATKQGDGSWFLGLKIHHALYDAVSLPAIMRRFVELCAANKDNEDQTVAVELGDSSKWRGIIKTNSSAENNRKRQTFWTEYLAGAGSTPFVAGSVTKQPVNSRVSLVQPSAISDISVLRSLCGKNGISVQALFLAAYAKLLHSLQGSGGNVRSVDQLEKQTSDESGSSDSVTLAGKRQDSGYSSYSTTQADPVQGFEREEQNHRSQDVVFGIYLANRSDLDTLDNLAYYPTLCLVPLRVRVSQTKDIVELASQIQHDLRVISAPENVGVGLWEIQQWTGITVDSFVNFLSFPGSEKDNELGDGKTRDVAEKFHLEEVQLREGVGEDGEQFGPGDGQDGEFVYPSEFEDLSTKVREAYPDAVDVEVSIQGDNSMTIGCFGSAQKLGDEDGAREVVKGIVDLLVGSGDS